MDTVGREVVVRREVEYDETGWPMQKGDTKVDVKQDEVSGPPVRVRWGACVLVALMCECVFAASMCERVLAASMSQALLWALLWLENLHYMLGLRWQSPGSCLWLRACLWQHS